MTTPVNNKIIQEWIGTIILDRSPSTVIVPMDAETIEHDMCFRSVPGNPTHDEVLNMVQQLYS